MSIVFFDGFETVGTETGLANEATVRPRIALRYDAYGNSGTPATNGWYLDDDHVGEGYAWRLGNNRANWLRVYTPNETGKTYVVGARVHIPDTTETDCYIFWPEGNTTGVPDGHFVVMCRDNTDLVVAGTSTSLNETVTDAFTPGSWHYVECKFKVNDTTGLVEVKIDDTQVLNKTNVDTNDFWGNVIAIRFGGTNISGSTLTDSGQDFFALDDIYILKTDGGNPDDFLGDRTTVKSLPPNGDNSVAWTPSSGTTHYTLIDENGSNNTDYIDETTNLDRDEFDLTNLGDSGATVHCIKIEAQAADVGDTNNNLDVEVESSGSRTQTSHAVTSASELVYEHYEADDPNTGSAWGASAVDSMRAGVEFNT
jgi:hypothetical protein